MDNLRRTECVVGELRKQRLAAGHGDDVLAFYLTIWFVWEDLSRRPRETASASPPFTPSETHVDQPSPMAIEPLMDDNLQMDIDPSLMVPAMPTVPPPSLQKSRRDRKYRKMQRGQEALVRSGPALMFPCPHSVCCGRKLTRSGFIDHV
jgi:hypothetical protein